MQLMFALVAGAVLSATSAKNPYGACAHVTRGEPPARTCAMMRQAGMGWVRCDFDWRSIETKKGVWDFSKFDKIVSECETAGIQFLPILGYSVPWAHPAHAHLDSWEEYVQKVVTHYGRRLPVLEVWNEENIGQFWHDPNPTNYLVLLRRTHETVKKIDPKIRVAFGGTSGVPFGFIEEVYRLGGAKWFDIMNIHPYSHPRRPEGSMDAQIERLRAMMERYGDADKPIWITEVGWPTHRAISEDAASLLLAGLGAARPDMKSWRMVYVPVDDADYAVESVLLPLKEVLSPESSLQICRSADLAKCLSRGDVDAVVYPFSEAYAADSVDAVFDFVKAGGVLVDFGGMPMWNPYRPAADGTMQRDKKTASYRDRQRMRIAETAWWIDKRYPKSMQVRPTAAAKGVKVPPNGFDGQRFLTDRLLKPGDKFIPLLSASTNGIEAVAAAVYRFNSDMKGAIVVSGLLGRGSCGTSSEERQAKMTARALGIAFAEGVERFFWYEFRQPDRDPSDPESYFGMVHDNFAPKPAYGAYMTFVDARPAGSVQRRGKWRSYDGKTYFPQWKRPDGRSAGMIWTLGHDRRKVGFSSPKMEFLDTVGARIRPVHDGNVYELALSDMPIYFLGGELDGMAIEDLARWVDPFVGTAGTGHTFPAACVPFGLVQAGPDTGNGSWDYCNGYRYGDRTICGFTQTHLNGTGCPDLGDIRIMPFRGETPRPSAFDHADESASPGFYSVCLKDAAVTVEVAAAERSAIYRISGKGMLRMLVDCAYGITDGDSAQEMTRSNVRLTGKDGLSGRNHRRKWVERDYSFAIRFDRPCKDVVELPKAAGQVAPRYLFDFDLGDGAKPLLVKVALSAEGDVAAAERNLAAEMSGWDFGAVRDAARKKWNAVLGCAGVEGTDGQKRNWYTALYHLFIQPNNIADAGAKPFYSTFSTWDTFRAAHPLYTILAPERAAEFVDSMLEQGRRTGHLPIWTLWGRDNQCMIGTHSVPVIVDWFLKEAGENSSSSRKEYWLAAYSQIKDTLTKPHQGRVKESWDLIDKHGYYPFDMIKGESVSRTMECAYDDWCAGVMAERLGYADDAVFFKRRSGNWRNVFDAESGFVRGRDSQGRWRNPFDPHLVGHGADTVNDFTEGNAFQYLWHVMQDPMGLVEAMGGREAFTERLDSLFVQPERVDGAGCVMDVTGLVGQYVHGNEPSHHVIYFYPLVGCPEKAAERIREVFDRFYQSKPDGLCGNDDCGQMSAWYVFSAMGFYPFNPCGGEYVIGAPQMPKVTLNLSGGKTFTMTARNFSRENKYVKSVTLNGKPVTGWKIRHADIMRGGTLEFEMCGDAKAFVTKYPR